MINEKSGDQRVPALRIVHLLGGLRAFDLGGEIEVGVDGLHKPMSLSRGAYGGLYATLEKLLLQPIGVQMIRSQDDLSGFNPPDWVAWRAPFAFSVMHVRHEWSHVRSAKLRDGNADVGHLASKIVTYLRLANLRLMQLSVAYHDTLRSQLRRSLSDPPTEPTRFSNMWGDAVDAAIHAFLSDAGALRDTLAEATWRLVLNRGANEVTSFAGLLKRTKGDKHPLLIRLHQGAAPGGWLKNLTDLRNEIVHVAPVGDSHEHSYMEIREMPHNGGGHLFQLHYPFTTKDWALRKGVNREVDYSDEEAVRRSVEDYDAFAKSSGDALHYAWRTLGRLVALAEEVRKAAGLSAPMPVITEADMVPGSFVTTRGE